MEGRRQKWLPKAGVYEIQVNYSEEKYSEGKSQSVCLIEISSKYGCSLQQVSLYLTVFKMTYINKCKINHAYYIITEPTSTNPKSKSTTFHVFVLQIHPLLDIYFTYFEFYGVFTKHQINMLLFKL